MNSRSVRFHLMVFAAMAQMLLLAAHAAYSADTAKKPGAKKEEIKEIPPVKGYLFMDNIKSPVELRGRTSKKVLVRFLDKSKDLLVSTSAIQAIDFKVDMMDYELQELVVKKKWEEAAAKIITAFQPTFEYIDLYENNAAEYLLDAGSYLIKSAREEMVGLPADNKLNESVKKKLTLAYKVFRYVEKADLWYPGSKTAQLKGVQCLVFLNEFARANEKFDQIAEPMVGDLSYGLYWLMKGTLLFQKYQVKDALDASIKAIAFDNKDIDAFPDSLLLAGLCYEHILDYHRARDTYFAAARLFQNTEWGEDAYRRLKYLMEKKLTVTVENKDIEKVFFDSEEDMNAKVEEFIKKKSEEDETERRQAEEEKAEDEEEKKLEEEQKKAEEELLKNSADESEAKEGEKDGKGSKKEKGAKE